MSIRFISDNININFNKYYKFTTIFSILCIIVSIFFVGTRGVHFGIDFKGGITAEISTEQSIENYEPIISQLKQVGFNEIVIQKVHGSNNLIINLENNHNQSIAITKLKEALSNSQIGAVNYRKIDYIGPQIGSKQILESIVAIICALIGMFIYLWLRFNWQFGIGGIVALIHDIIITVGFISITKIEFNLSSTAALLTIIGYSVNDSVVIYDRIRELLKKNTNQTLVEIINISINSTLSRTILTSGTTLLASIPLILICKGTVRDFSLIVFFGIFVGTYSSIFISAPILSEKILIRRRVPNHKHSV